MSYYRSRPVTPVEPITPVSKYGNLPRQTETEVPVTEVPVMPVNEVPEVETEIETENTQPIISFTIPTLIRVLELIHKDVPSDDILHYVAEKIIEVGTWDDVIDSEAFVIIAAVIPIRVMAAQRRGRDGRRI